jgi:phage tail-like protein
VNKEVGLAPLQPAALVVLQIQQLAGQFDAPEAGSAARPPVDARQDPYKNFRHRLKWNGQYVAAFSKTGSLTRTTDVIEQGAGSDPATPHETPGPTKFGAITLERGVTRDMNFHDWASRALIPAAAAGATAPAQDFRRDIELEVYDATGRPTIAYKIHGCWVSEYRALPDLDANANAVAIEHIKLENEGWERDPSVAAPPAPGEGSGPAVQAVSVSARTR